MKRLPVAEIFRSLQGEGPVAGLPTAFIRLVGCPLRCFWCDSAYAFTGGTLMTVAEIVSRIRTEAVPAVCITGGEPLIHGLVTELMVRLVAVPGVQHLSVETSGSEPIQNLPAEVVRVVDWKAPSSGAGGSFFPANLDHLRTGDALKFVVAEAADLHWLEELEKQYRLSDLPATVFVQAAMGETVRLNSQQVADWLIRSGLPFRFAIQLHKILWPGVERGV